MRRKYTQFLAVAALTTASGQALAEEVPASEPHNTTAAVFESRAQASEGALDLRMGDLTYILTPEQLERALGSDETMQLTGTETPADRQVEQIEVRATREQHGGNARSDIPFGFASIAWAFNNPSEAWRLFTPVEWDS